jgi:hypothetical protein
MHDDPSGRTWSFCHIGAPSCVLNRPGNRFTFQSCGPRAGRPLPWATIGRSGGEGLLRVFPDHPFSVGQLLDLSAGKQNAFDSLFDNRGRSALRGSRSTVPNDTWCRAAIHLAASPRHRITCRH